MLAELARRTESNIMFLCCSVRACTLIKLGRHCFRATRLLVCLFFLGMGEGMGVVFVPMAGNPSQPSGGQSSGFPFMGRLYKAGSVSCQRSDAMDPSHSDSVGIGSGPRTSRVNTRQVPPRMGMQWCRRRRALWQSVFLPLLEASVEEF